MKLVESLKEIAINMKTLDGYVSNKADPEYSYALDLIKRGICFIADSSSGKYKFYPSRFIGYVDNSMNQHSNNTKKDGRETNPAISKILGCDPSPDPNLEKEYAAYCRSLGINVTTTGVFGISRKYWRI